MSMRPHLAMVLSTRACTSSLRDTLQGCASTSKPCFSNSARTASQASALRLYTTTLQPGSASSSAMDLPMPRVETVISATLPLKSNDELDMGISLCEFQYD